jgi:peptidyl-prolyl cis-trans isomerase C
MQTFFRLFTALAAIALLLAPPVATAQEAKKAATKADAPAKGKDLYSSAFFDFMLKQRLAQGQPDSPELRAAIRDELNTRELLVREAKKQGLDKTSKAEMDLSAQTVLVRAYMADYLRAHPVPDDVLRKEYDNIKKQMGDKEYKVRHILVEKEDEAKALIKQLNGGASFEDLAKKNSKDPGSGANGGDLDFAAPGSYVPEFSQAMVKLKKGELTQEPVKTQFGFHIIKLEDTRQAQFPPIEEVKPQIKQRLEQQKLGSFLEDLRTKAKTDYKFSAN